jgi:hypothetical protein
MILGTEPRVRTMLQLAERDSDADLAEQQTSPARDHRDRGHFLAPRLYPEATSSVASESM